MGYIAGNIAVQLSEDTIMLTGTLDGIPKDAREKLCQNYHTKAAAISLVSIGFINDISRNIYHCRVDKDKSYPKIIRGGMDGLEEYLAKDGRDYTYLFIEDEWYQSASNMRWIELQQPCRKEYKWKKETEETTAYGSSMKRYKVEQNFIVNHEEDEYFTTTVHATNPNEAHQKAIQQGLEKYPGTAPWGTYKIERIPDHD